MKKIVAIIATALLASGIGACNQTDKSKEVSSVQDNSGLILEEVYNNSVEQADSVKSMKMTIEGAQHIEVPAKSASIDIHTSINMSMIDEPISFYYKGYTTFGDPKEGALEMESYMTAEQSLYVNDTGQWMKFPSYMWEDIVYSTLPYDPANQLKDLGEFKDDFEIEHTKNAYILSLSSSDEKFKGLIQRKLEKNPLGPNVEEFMENLDIRQIDYEIHIDKKTFNMSMLNIELETVTIVEGEEMVIKMDLVSNYSDYNQVEEIKVPQEIIDSATEI